MRHWISFLYPQHFLFCPFPHSSFIIPVISVSLWPNTDRNDSVKIYFGIMVWGDFSPLYQGAWPISSTRGSRECSEDVHQEDGRPGGRVRPGPGAELKLSIASLQGPISSNNRPCPKGYPASQYHKGERAFQSISLCRHFRSKSECLFLSSFLMYWLSLQRSIISASNQCRMVWVSSVLHLFSSLFISAIICTIPLLSSWALYYSTLPTSKPGDLVHWFSAFMFKVCNLSLDIAWATEHNSGTWIIIM